MSLDEIRAICIVLAIIISIFAFKLKIPGADVILFVAAMGIIYLILSYFNLMSEQVFMPGSIILLCGYVFIKYRKNTKS